MVRKGVVEQVINKYNLRVRIPSMHKIKGTSGATDTANLPIASICAPPGYNVLYNVGDVVYVVFEYDDNTTPIVLGKLFIGDN